MRSRSTFLLACAFVLALGTGAATAGSIPVLIFDENGATNFSVQGSLQPDPTQKGNPLELTFQLPFRVYTGSVGIYDDVIGGTLGDALRFTNGDPLAAKAG